MPKNDPVRTTLLVVVAAILLLYLALVSITMIQRWKLGRMEAAITNATYSGQEYASYRDALCNLKFMYHVDEWDDGEPRGSGRSIGAVTHYVKGTFDVDILVTAEFDKHQQLLGLTMQRRTHGF